MEVLPEVGSLLTAAGVRFAYLFGSRATGTHRPDSDADIAFFADRPLPLLAESALEIELAAALHVPAVDLVDLRRAPLHLVGRVLTDGVVIHGRNEPARVEFEVRNRALYFDFRPLEQAQNRAYLKRVATGGLP